MVGSAGTNGRKKRQNKLMHVYHNHQWGDIKKSMKNDPMLDHPPTALERAKAKHGKQPGNYYSPTFAKEWRYSVPFMGTGIYNLRGVGQSYGRDNNSTRSVDLPGGVQFSKTGKQAVVPMSAVADFFYYGIVSEELCGVMRALSQKQTDKFAELKLMSNFGGFLLASGAQIEPINNCANMHQMLVNYENVVQTLTPTFVDVVSSVAADYTYNYFSGNRITPKAFSARRWITFNYDTARGTACLRIIEFQWSKRDVAPEVSDILEYDADGQRTLSPYNDNNRSYMNILYDDLVFGSRFAKNALTTTNTEHGAWNIIWTNEHLRDVYFYDTSQDATVETFAAIDGFWSLYVTDNNEGYQMRSCIEVGFNDY